MITLIVAVARDGAIGKDGDLLWHLSGDLKRFKALTTGHAVVMGRKTWESLPRRPLPGRTNIVITRNPAFEAPGAVTVNSLPEAVSAAEKAEGDVGDIFIIGGSSVYEAFLPMADAIDLTVVEAEYPDADAWFRLPADGNWQQADASPLLHDEKSGLDYRHILLKRDAGCHHK